MKDELSKPEETPAPLIFGLMTIEQAREMDADKMQKFLNMKLQVEDREAERQFNCALADFQAEMPPVFKWRAESKGKYNYAAYDDIMRLARPILRKNGLSVSCSQEESETSLTIKMTVSHRGGHSRLTTYTTPKDGPIKTADGRNVTSQAQAQSSSNTYARRICLCNALDIVVTDEDDDGKAASTQFLNEHEVSEVSAVLDKFGKDRDDVLSRMLEWVGVESLQEIPAARFKSVMTNLKKKLGQ